jgi:adenine deaminase
MDHTLRLAVKCGIEPLLALQMATNNAPYYFRLKHRKGAIAIGYEADLVVFDDLKNFDARLVFKSGKLVAKNGELLVPCSSKTAPKISNTVNIANIGEYSFKLLDRKRPVRVIKIIPEQITTEEELVRLQSDGKHLNSDTKKDILKIAVIERHHASGRHSVGFVKGFGLKRGAIASTVCHDSHNIIVVGTNDEDMLAACVALKKSGGGFVAIEGGKIREILPLPIAGLMSDQSASHVANNYQKLEAATKKMGVKIGNPFFALSFLALSVVPALRITDKGIIDSRKENIVGLYA